MNWILLVLFYGIAKGLREVVKKKSLAKNTVIEVLFFYTLLSFLMVLPDAGNAWGITWAQAGWIALKSFFIFTAWICGFHAIVHLPISFLGVLDLSRVLFATLLGIIVLHEKMGGFQTVGLMLVLLGLFLLGTWSRKKDTGFSQNLGKKHTGAFYIFLALLSCVLNAISGLMDKILMKEVTSSQLQFFYMAFLVGYYVIYILVTRTKICFHSLVKNYWIYILSILFVLADRALFIANSYPDSKVTVMTLIKQSGCIVVILAGKWVFHEKNISRKLVCSAVIIAGIVIAVIK